MILDYRVLEGLSAEHGDGFYLADVPRFREAYQDLVAAFRRHYPSTELAYSYKTNYLPVLCKEVDRLGGWAEVVSWLEYQLALRIGVSASRIIFNGPYKRDEEISQALRWGSVVNLDSLHEVDAVEAAATRDPHAELRVGLRCNLASAASGSRFGFDVDSWEFEEALTRLGRLPGCRVVGLHCHVSTLARSAESYQARTRQILTLTRAHLSAPPLYVNLGGGFFSRMEDRLRRQLDFEVPSFADYAAAGSGAVAEAYPNGGPTLIIEPGTALAANALSFAAKVVAVKDIRGRRLALVGGSVHTVKPTLHNKRLTTTIYRSPAADVSNGRTADIVGYTCMEHDIMLPACEDPLSPGDFVVFEDVGAYTLVMKPPFISGAPPVVAHDGREFSLARRREEFEDVFATYVLD